MRPSSFAFLLLALAGCAGAPDESARPLELLGAPADSTADLGAFFPDSTAGTFVLYDAQSGVTTRYGRAAERRTPASTFKIFNSLVALDAGAVADEHEVVEWDGVERWLPVWNQDQTLETALQRSAVWVHQELARRAGRDTLQAALTREAYGNATIGEAADRFWLDGSLQVSADEQIAFLRRLRAGETGFSDRAMGIVRGIMIAETTAGTVLRGKTGWALGNGENLGWWVGWVERGADAYVFALWIESDDAGFDMVSVRKPTAERILAHLGAR